MIARISHASCLGNDLEEGSVNLNETHLEELIMRMESYDGLLELFDPLLLANARSFSASSVPNFPKGPAPHLFRRVVFLRTLSIFTSSILREVRLT